MAHRISVQNPYHYSDIPTLALIRRWVKKALTVTERPICHCNLTKKDMNVEQDFAHSGVIPAKAGIHGTECAVCSKWIPASAGMTDRSKELCIRIVDENESAELNQRFRNKSGPTNILSFPSPFDAHQDPLYLGDIAICAPLVNKEAEDQTVYSKPLACQRGASSHEQQECTREYMTVESGTCNKAEKSMAKSIELHWAHLVIHGVLHLMEFDHETPEQATQMETLEINLLNTLGYDNPYGGD